MNRLWKWLHSFVIKEWGFEDYPVRTRRRHKRLQVWTAQIEGWWVMAGDGPSREAALEALRVRFDQHAQRHPLPRPGAEVPITLGTHQDELREEQEREEERQSNG